MLEVSIAIIVHENASPGSIVHVSRAETIMGNPEDLVGHWAAVKQVAERLIDETKRDTIDQIDEAAGVFARAE